MRLPLSAEQLGDGFLGLETERLGCDFSVFEEDHCRDGHDAESFSDFGNVIHIDLDELDVCAFAGEFFNDRSDHLAGAAPVGIEINEYCSVVFQDLIEILFILDRKSVV